MLSTKRLLAGLLLPIATGGVLAGCGGGDPAGQNGAKASQRGQDMESNEATGPASATGTAAGEPSLSKDSAAVDRAFVRQMIPHHVMAVDMADDAQVEARRDELKAFAAKIIEDQGQEIEAMETIATRLGVEADESSGDADPTRGASMAEDARTLGLSMDDMGMSMSEQSATGAAFDLQFLTDMTEHHEGAIRMAKAQLMGGEDAALKEIATAIVTAQEREIAQMAQWKRDWQA